MPDDSASAEPLSGEGFVDLAGRRFYRIGDFDRLEPFLMTVVSASDCWLFVSSTGGLTAGRVEPDSALFPYVTEDKVADAAGTAGGLSLFRVRRTDPEGRPEDVLWEPFRGDLPANATGRRALYKDVLGSELVFEEERPDLGLRVRVSWQASPRFGIVRTCELAATGDGAVEVELLDGFVNLLPAGIEVAAQNRLSSLLDAYKRAERDESGLGMFWLSSRLTDLAEPSESLQANVAWQVGLPEVLPLLSTRQVPAFRAGRPLVAETDVRGMRGAYLVNARIAVAPDRPVRWSVVGDVARDTAQVVDLRARVRQPVELARALDEDLTAGRTDLTRIVAAADGLQAGGDERATAHHAANVLFNVMRGGVPADGYRTDPADFRAFLTERSPRTSLRHAALLAELPEALDVGALQSLARTTQDPDLIRLASEYLPLTFSRRHGDPSRPWNTFRIVLRDAGGAARLNFEGNWRDIFQNWEALAWSFPEYTESMIAVFLDATTIDGYNPYRISRAGIDWEVPDPDDPWANIGYWGDHQIVYLLRLLEASARFHPGRLRELLGQRLFTHADVPYRIASYEQLLRDPYDTIAFDAEHASLIARRVDQEGPDGRLAHGKDGELVRASLAEKLLLLLLAKLVNLVPDGGIWLNTQRPEWNDANNALVGRGLSVVTLAYLRRYVAFLSRLLTGDVRIGAELAELAASVGTTLAAHADRLTTGPDGSGLTATDRRVVMDELGSAGSRYRERVYAGASGELVTVPGRDVAALLDSARLYLESGLRANRRADGLFHSYNLLELSDGAADVRRLPEMLEGQVAILSSGLLDADDSLALLGALRASALYRPDRHSYQLYPDKDLPGFLQRNRISTERAAGCPLLGTLVSAGDRRLVVPDGAGELHFAAPIRNERDVEAVLAELQDDPELAPVVAASRTELLAIFEEVFRHSEFTGRSGSFFAFEGLGSIYWHMVSKLLLAVQEACERAVAEGAGSSTMLGLARAYEDVRTGLGYCTSAAEYGAFPIDPYSHTPAGHGARQPGMTGQVKEEVLTRFGELGLRVEDGCIVFRPTLLRSAEWTTVEGVFDLVDLTGQSQLDLPADALAFTYCQVPVRYRRGAALLVQVHLADGRVVDFPDGRIDPELSAAIFQRRGTVTRVEVWVPA